MIVNRHKKLGGKARRKKRFLTAGAGVAAVAARTNQVEQQWSWLECEGKMFLSNGNYGLLHVDARRVLGQSTEGSEIHYDPKTGALQEVASGRVARMVKANTTVSMVKKFKPKLPYQWDLVYVN